MEQIREILIDSLNGFSLRSIPLFLFQLLSSGLMSYSFGYLILKKFNIRQDFGVVVTMTIALLASLVKYALPFSVLASAVIIAFSLRSEKKVNDQFSFLVCASLGIGCGIGSVVQTGIGLILLMLILLFVPVEEGNKE